MKSKKVLFLSIILVHLFSVLPALSVEPTGYEIAKWVYDRDTGEDSYSKIKMMLIDKRGHKKFRSLTTATKSYNDLNKSFTRFTEPADIRGTAFLTWENKGADDDQFLYLPSLKRVRRIVTSQKKSRFVNTDYTYEDMQTREVDEDKHQLINEEKYNGYDCWVLQSEPLKKGNSQYRKRVSWIVKKFNVPIKTEYYDRRGRLFKRYRAAILKKIDGIWTAMEYEMHDMKRKHRTLMKLVEVRYNRGLADRIFTKTYLQYAK